MRRHALVWLAPQAPWQVLTPGADARLRAWAEARLPFVVARRDPVTDGDQLRLGVPLPLAEQRRRLSLRIEPGHVLRTTPPPALAEVTEGLPAPWRDEVRLLLADTRDLDVPPRVFGSFAWQHLTGLLYLRASSDLDLLWEVEDHAQADRLATRMQRWEREHRLRIDGELRFPGERAVSWREYASGAARVMVKTGDACWLSPRDALLSLQAAA